MSGNSIEKEINGLTFEARRIPSVMVQQRIMLRLGKMLAPLAQSQGEDAFHKALSSISDSDLDYLTLNMLKYVYLKTDSGYAALSDGIGLLHEDKVDFFMNFQLMYLSFEVNFMEFIKKNLPSFTEQLSKQSGRLNS